MSNNIPRLEFRELRDDIQIALKAKYERLGYLGEFFAATAHQADALKAFIDFTDASKGELDQRIVELIALTVATMKAVAYEKNQHERLSIKLGYGRDWVFAVEALQPDVQNELSDLERVIQRFVIFAVEHDGLNATPLLDEVVKQLGHEQAIAVLMVIGRYTTHAMMVNSLNIGPPVPSIFEDNFGGE